MFEMLPEESALLRILGRDARYAMEAYEFTRRAVTYASEVVFATGTHVSGQELLEAIRRYALEQYGLMTQDVLGAWGLTATEDFGEIVFSLVDEGLLSKTDDDSKEDFRGVYSFEEVFDPRGYWQEVGEFAI